MGFAVASGLNGSPPYAYTWSNGENTSQIDSLFTGVYTVTISDSDGCSIEDSVTIDSPDEIIGQITIFIRSGDIWRK